MSIFFWKKKKSETEPENAAEPAAEIPVEAPAEEVTAEEEPPVAETPRNLRRSRRTRLNLRRRSLWRSPLR